MKINNREGLRRIVVVMGVMWALIWSVVFAKGLYDYIHLLNFADRKLYPLWQYDDALGFARGQMWGAAIFGLIIPAIAYFVGRYIVRGFLIGRDENEG